MRAKGTGNPRIEFDPAKVITTGIHLVRIIKIEPLRKRNGEYVINKHGEGAIVIGFADESNRTIELIIWLNELSQWIMDKLNKALNIKVSEGAKMNKDDLIGRTLYIGVQEIIYVVDGVIIPKPLEYRVIPGKLLLDAGTKPIVMGEPTEGYEPEGTGFRLYEDMSNKDVDIPIELDPNFDPFA